MKPCIIILLLYAILNFSKAIKLLAKEKEKFNTQSKVKIKMEVMEGNLIFQLS